MSLIMVALLLTRWGILASLAHVNLHSETISGLSLNGHVIIASLINYEMRQGVPRIIETRAQTNVPVGPSGHNHKRRRIDFAVAVHTSSPHQVEPVAHILRAVYILALGGSGYFPKTGIPVAASGALAVAVAGDWDAAVVEHCSGGVLFGFRTRRPQLPQRS